MTGLGLHSLCANLTSFVPGRKLDDDGNVLLRFEGGAKGVLIASQISAGEENGLRLKVYGETGGLKWHQEEPMNLFVKPNDEPMQLRRPNNPYLSDAAKNASKNPAGHPEAFLEAFANVYRGAAARCGHVKKVSLFQQMHSTFQPFTTGRGGCILSRKR